MAFRMITALLVIAGVGVSIFSGLIINIMSDELFHPAASAIPYLVIAGIFQCLTIFNNFSFMLTDRTLEVTKNNAVTAIAISIFYFVLIPLHGFVGASIAFALGSIVQYVYALHNGNKLYPLKIRQAPLVISITILLTATTIDRGVANSNWTVESILLKSAIFITAFFSTLYCLSSKPERKKLAEKLSKGVKNKLN